MVTHSDKIASESDIIMKLNTETQKFEVMINEMV